jgi:hypothetical protein
MAALGAAVAGGALFGMLGDYLKGKEQLSNEEDLIQFKQSLLSSNGLPPELAALMSTGGGSGMMADSMVRGMMASMSSAVVVGGAKLQGSTPWLQGGLTGTPDVQHGYAPSPGLMSTSNYSPAMTSAQAANASGGTPAGSIFNNQFGKTVFQSAGFLPSTNSLASDPVRDDPQPTTSANTETSWTINNPIKDPISTNLQNYQTSFGNTWGSQVDLVAGDSNLMPETSSAAEIGEVAAAL